mmetsp:Transcript_3630/g.2690  ORF Transcript_3630/g.2690 Transcript_3630/m.2690 type:complete len:87 (-) Transcript_3630:21-281(-)
MASFSPWLAAFCTNAITGMNNGKYNNIASVNYTEHRNAKNKPNKVMKIVFMIIPIVFPVIVEIESVSYNIFECNSKLFSSSSQLIF